MLHHICEVVLKFYAVNVSSVFGVHEPETKLVALVFRPIAKDVHDKRKLIERDVVVFILIKDVKDTVAQKRILILTKETHNRAELFSSHNSASFCLNRISIEVLLQILQLCL